MLLHRIVNLLGDHVLLAGQITVADARSFVTVQQVADLVVQRLVAVPVVPEVRQGFCHLEHQQPATVAAPVLTDRGCVQVRQDFHHQRFGVEFGPVLGFFGLLDHLVELRFANQSADLLQSRLLNHQTLVLHAVHQILDHVLIHGE